jgi:hypothetical protein
LEKEITVCPRPCVGVTNSYPANKSAEKTLNTNMKSGMIKSRDVKKAESNDFMGGVLGFAVKFISLRS